MVNFTRRTALGLLAAAPLAGKAWAQGAAKAAFVLRGPAEGNFWNADHLAPIEAVRAAYEGRVAIEHAVSDAMDQDAKIVGDLVAGGATLIFGCDSSFTQAMFPLSMTNKDVNFEICEGFIQDGHLGSYVARTYQGRVPQGLVAGNMTTSGKIGFIAPFPTAEVLQNINAFFLAARKSNPQVDLEIVWLNSWFDPEAEAEATRHLVDHGADVIVHATRSNAPLEVAKELGAYGFGLGMDIKKDVSSVDLLPMGLNWEPYYAEQLDAMLAGSWAAGLDRYGLADDVVKLGAYSPDVPNAARLQAEDAAAKIKAGTEHAFAGPINKQDGSVWLTDGEVAKESDVVAMDFLVQGIRSIIKK